MHSSRVRELALTAGVVVVASVAVLAQELDQRVERRLDQAAAHLDRAEGFLAKSDARACRRALDSAARTLEDLDKYYEGKYDPNHPKVQDTRARLTRLREEVDAAAPVEPSTGTGATESGGGPSRMELEGAVHFLDEFEQTIEKAGGRPTPLGSIGKEALDRIMELATKYPDHPKVQELRARGARVLKLSKGETVDITPEMLAYRKIPELINEKLKALTEESWNTLVSEVQTSEGGITDPFPPPDPRKIPVSEIVGNQVILPGILYPQNEFSYLGSQYLFVGTPSRGYYYVDLGSRAWAGAYEALRRYRHEVSGDFPQDLEWTVVGEIIGLHLLVPQAGEEKTRKAELGWIVEPRAIRVPGKTVAYHEPENEVGGLFAGEAQLEEIKDAMYTVKEVPPQASPEELFQVYRAAIKEKNQKLFMACIDPARLKTPKAVWRAKYHWELHQHRFATVYCQSVIDRIQIDVLKGADVDSKYDEFFLDEGERKDVEKHAEPMLERATLWLKAYDERGRQVGKPHPLYMRRYAKERWYIEEASWPL